MDKLVYLYYPLVLLLLLWGSKWFFGRNKWNEDFFSLDQSKMWQGFFAVCILLHHTGQKTCAPWMPNKKFIVPGLEFFVPIGYFFVAFFLVCSGYGLYVSYKRKPDYLKGFLRKRVLPLILTFYAVEWMYLATRLLMGQKLDTIQIIYYFTGIQLANPNSWFVLALPIFYVMFWLCFRFIKKENAALTGVFVLVLAYVMFGCTLNHLDKDMWLCGEWWYNTAIFFPLGLLFGKHKDAIVRGVKDCYLPIMALTVLFGVIAYFGGELVLNKLGYYCEWVKEPTERFLFRFMSVMSQTGAALMFVNFFVMLGLKVKIGNGVLRFMSAITLEFYLVHGLFVELFGCDFMEIKGIQSLCYIKNVFLYVIVVAACSLVVTLLLRKILHPKQPFFPKGKKPAKVENVVEEAAAVEGAVETAQETVAEETAVEAAEEAVAEVAEGAAIEAAAE